MGWRQMNAQIYAEEFRPHVPSLFRWRQGILLGTIAAGLVHHNRSIPAIR